MCVTSLYDHCHCQFPVFPNRIYPRVLSEVKWPFHPQPPCSICPSLLLLPIISPIIGYFYRSVCGVWLSLTMSVSLCLCLYICIYPSVHHQKMWVTVCLELLQHVTEFVGLFVEWLNWFKEYAVSIGDYIRPEDTQKYTAGVGGRPMTMTMTMAPAHNYRRVMGCLPLMKFTLKHI